MISGKNKLYVHFTSVCVYQIKIQTDNLHRGLKYLTNLPLKLRVDIQYLNTLTTTYYTVYISVNTQT